MYTLVPYRRHSGNSLSNSLFNDNFFRSFFNMSDMVGPSGFRVDIKDQGDHFALEAELPGVKEDQIELSVDNGMLTIRADIKSETKNETENYYYSERRSGHVERSFNIEGVNEDEITASCENGILSVKLPKLAPVQEKTARRIQIGSGDTSSDQESQKSLE